MNRWWRWWWQWWLWWWWLLLCLTSRLWVGTKASEGDLSQLSDSGKITDYWGYGHKVLLWYDRCNVGLIYIYTHDTKNNIYTCTYTCNWYIKCFHVFPIYAWLVFGPNTGSICTILLTIHVGWSFLSETICFTKTNNDPLKIIALKIQIRKQALSLSLYTYIYIYMYILYVFFWNMTCLFVWRRVRNKLLANPKSSPQKWRGSAGICEVFPPFLRQVVDLKAGFRQQKLIFDWAEVILLMVQKSG